MRIYEDLSTIRDRLGVFRSGVVIAFGVLLAYFFSLQILRGRHFLEEAEKNRTRPVTLTAPRGPILDRNGKVLVENRPSFNIVLVPDMVQLDVAGPFEVLARVPGWTLDLVAATREPVRTDRGLTIVPTTTRVSGTSHTAMACALVFAIPSRVVYLVAVPLSRSHATTPPRVAA